MSQKKKSGFAGMSEERRHEICRQGGIAAHRNGRAHEFTSEEARQAGRKGGVAVSRNREHMSAIGRMGGIMSRVRPRPPVIPGEGGDRSSP